MESGVHIFQKEAARICRAVCYALLFIAFLLALAWFTQTALFLFRILKLAHFSRQHYINA